MENKNLINKAITVLLITTGVITFLSIFYVLQYVRFVSDINQFNSMTMGLKIMFYYSIFNLKDFLLNFGTLILLMILYSSSNHKSFKKVVILLCIIPVIDFVISSSMTVLIIKEIDPIFMREIIKYFSNLIIFMITKGLLYYGLVLLSNNQKMKSLNLLYISVICFIVSLAIGIYSRIQTANSSFKSILRYNYRSTGELIDYIIELLLGITTLIVIIIYIIKLLKSLNISNDKKMVFMTISKLILIIIAGYIGFLGSQNIYHYFDSYIGNTINYDVSIIRYITKIVYLIIPLFVAYVPLMLIQFIRNDFNQSLDVNDNYSIEQNYL